MKNNVMKNNEYKLSNHIISRKATSNATCKASFNEYPTKPYGNAKIMPNGISLYKEHTYYPSTYPKIRKPKTDIAGFSKASQRKFRDVLMRLDLKPYMCDSSLAEENNGFFLSLVWPSESILNKFSIARDLEKLSKKLSNDFKEFYLGAIWKKELQRSGNPHIHVIALFSKKLVSEHVREWVENAWSNIIGEWLPYAADTRPLYGIPEQFINYLLKANYEDAGALCIGRIWGKWNGYGLPFIEPDICELSKEDYTEVLSRLKCTVQAEHSKIIQNLNDNWKGARIIGNGDILSQLLEDLPSYNDGYIF